MHLLPLLILLAVFPKDRTRDLPPRVTLDAEGESVTVLLMEVERQTGVRVEIDASAKGELDPWMPVWLKVSDISMDSALALLCTPRGLWVTWKDRKHVLITARQCQRFLNR
jgi:hypothetical protein